ncbi:MAG TPA: hypothetical protein VFP61_04135 [Acidimicrobiales bacterium]|nr:hypothetical protein [Acidimicrobiales bacterium]
MLLEVGRVVRAHGLRGQVIVELTTNRPERAEVGTVLHAGERPLTVTASAVAPAGTGHGRWLVSFAGVTTRAEADGLRGQVLSAPPIDDPDALWVHELIGARVVEAGAGGRERGTVTDVLANPASDLLVLDTGALVPLAFVVSASGGVVEIDAPDGLFDLG